MIVSSITLNNIKSYIKETINFSKGINLLWGDIGSGKSTVLQSLEFALFGLGKDEGNLLLRKGEKEGSVSVVFKDKKNEIKITRFLKKQSKSIRQTKCYLSINNSQEELSPTELNYKILNLFKIPKTKHQKNLAYRFIIYTRQEELKEILNASSEIRLEIIRKAFNIEKYKQINNGITIFLRNKLKFLKEVLSKEVKSDKNLKDNKEELENKSKELNKDKKKLEKNLSFYNEKNKLNNEKLNLVSNKKNELNKEINKINIKLNEIKHLIKEKEEKLVLKKKLNKENKTILENNSFQYLEKEYLDNKKKYEDFIEKKKEFDYLSSKKKEVDDKLKKLNEEEYSLKNIYNTYKEEIKNIDESGLYDKIKELDKKIKYLEKLKENLSYKEEDLKSLNIMISKKEDLINGKKTTIKNIELMKYCENCFQKVNKEHKEKIKKNLSHEIKKEKEEIEKLKKKKEEINKEYEKEKKEVDNLTNLKNDKYKLELDLKNFKKKSFEITDCIKKISSINIEKEKLKNNFNFEYYEKVKNKIDIFNDFLIQFKDLENNYNKIVYNIEELKKIEKRILEVDEKLENRESWKNKKKKLEEKLKNIEEKEKILKNNEKKLVEIINKLQYKKGIVDNQLLNNKKNIEDLDKKIKEIELKKIKLEKLKNLEDWLSNDLTSLFDIIEKFLFRKFYSEFNDIFEEVFRKLIEDNNIEVRLDDTFSPIIEQNGYDLSISNLSGGEKSSVALAYRFGLSFVIESNLSHKIKLNFIILDEPTDGFSNTQVNKLAHLLKDFNFEQTIIVSHDEKLTTVADNIIKLEKINHVSRVYKN